MATHQRGAEAARSYPTKDGRKTDNRLQRPHRLTIALLVARPLNSWPFTSSSAGNSSCSRLRAVERHRGQPVQQLGCSESAQPVPERAPRRRRFARKSIRQRHPGRPYRRRTAMKSLASDRRLVLALWLLTAYLLILYAA